jgi:hypothetical protein
MRIIVTGGRDFDDGAAVFAALDRIHAQSAITEVVHGGAKGADTLAAEWAAANSVAQEVYKPDWARYGRGAGPARNRDMAAAGADLVVAFPGGRGTADMCKQAERAGIKVVKPLDEHA